MWQLFCDTCCVLWWSGMPALGRGRVASSKLLSGASAGDELLILLREKRGANSLQFLLLGLLDIGEG